jgi:predicted nicotinamide N-methyase
MDFKAFICANTIAAPVPAVPEIRLMQATEITPIWQATESELQKAGVEPPFWAFPWAGGQALARYVLDNPEIVSGRRVLDFASGSGLVAIAAMKAGAASVTAVDIDSASIAAIEVNAELNQVDIKCLTEDLLSGAPPAETDDILAGDVFYERALAAKAINWLKSCAAAGQQVYLADPGRKYFDGSGMEQVARFDIPTTLELEAREMRQDGIRQD